MAPAPKRTKTIEARRQDLIRGTIASIAALGYNNSTVQTICDEAGLSRGLISHYFKGKDDLLLEAFRFLVVEADADTREAVRAAGPDPLDQLLAATEVAFKRAKESRANAMVWLACWGVAPWNPQMLELYHKLSRRYRRWVGRIIAEAAAQRGLAIDAEKAALTYTQMIDGFWIGWLMDKHAYGTEDAAIIIRDWLLDLFGERPNSRGGKNGETRK
ncbi:TetR family transcriptional regulator C-terminal domain-containing protein [Dongia sp.]|uniref:TetR family transcriptional regulator C-terminal domain-containing protein n=1 Tax=Dongia sp. TaxID=1977262 RepID=UPI0035AECDBC